MIASLSVLLMAAAALGSGAALLRCLAPGTALPPGDRMTWSFVVGIGTLGWLVFLPALAQALSPLALGLLCVACLPGLAFVLRGSERLYFPILSPTGKVLAAGLTLALILDLFEGLSPPADADSLAYHFALPKLFLEAGGLFFVPRANDGAVPMLQQMTYMTALSLGGERAMTLWAMLTGWSATAATFSVARRHVGTDWALAAALAFHTVPAVVYGGGSGQVEVRNAAFALLAATAAVDAMRKSDMRHAALAGTAAGFYAASKYPGLLFVAACTLPLLFQRRWLVCGTAYAAAVLVAGGQWYGWNAWNTGDPFFPMLYGWLPYRDDLAWDAVQHAFYQEVYRGAEKPYPATLLSLLLYPFQATFSFSPLFESRLVGFGPLVLLLLPAAGAGVWLRRSSLRHSPLLGVAVVCLFAYTLWFFLGPSVRIRFYLPLYPLLLICVVAAAQRTVQSLPQTAAPISAAFAVTLAFQLGTQAIFSLNYGRHVVSGEDRGSFLARNVSLYAGVVWLNSHLGPRDRVAVFDREVNYLLEVPYFYINSVVDGRIDYRLGPENLERIWRQFRDEHVTHILIDKISIDNPGGQGIGAGLAALKQQACLVEAAEIATQRIVSRTLSSGQGANATAVILKLNPETCSFAAQPEAASPSRGFIMPGSAFAGVNSNDP